MNVHLMYPDTDFNIKEDLSEEEKILVEDLQLEPIFHTMGSGSEFIYSVVKVGILSPLTEKETILYRQEVVKDVFSNLDTIEKLYVLSKEARDAEKKSRFGFFTHYLGGVLYSSIELMRLLLDLLKRLREIAIENRGNFSSLGFKNLFEEIIRELTPEYFKEIEMHLKNLEFKDGISLSAALGRGNKGINYTLLRPQEKKNNLINRIFSKREPSYTFTIDERDESGERALSEIREKGINSVTNALAQSVEHILHYFDTLKTELAFYIGVSNLYTYLEALGAPTCFPKVLSRNEKTYIFSDLYDPALTITLKKKAVGNTLNAKDKNLFIITGANQGGKTTFLRSIGIAQLMMQAGIFVSAKEFQGPIQKGIFTHFRKEEDRDMESGKLDEELKRISQIIGKITPNALILFNESFSSTNEKEGGEIANQIVSALVESGITVFFVTHMYTFSFSLYKEKRKDTLFLHAERDSDGTRTFKIVEGPPQRTGYAKDLLKGGI